MSASEGASPGYGLQTISDWQSFRLTFSDVSLTCSSTLLLATRSSYQSSTHLSYPLHITIYYLFLHSTGIPQTSLSTYQSPHPLSQSQTSRIPQAMHLRLRSVSRRRVLHQPPKAHRRDRIQVRVRQWGEEQDVLHGFTS